MSDAIIIGGGFFGCCLGLHLSREGQKVVIFERESDLLQRASYVNQARVHNGYHYPRAILTALRSRVNYEPFLKDFEGCVVDEFDAYYAVGKILSKVTAAQFKTFCQRIGAPLKAAPASVRKLLDSNLIEDVFSVRECAFDAVKLKELLKERLARQGVRVETGAAVLRVEPAAEGLRVQLRRGAVLDEASARRVYNCTYADMNRILKNSGLPAIPFKYELTEMALLEPPEPLRRLAITVMCGPFWSFFPFPPRNLHTLSHVRYTPHGAWREKDEPPVRWGRDGPSQVPSAFPHMIKDAARYLPRLKDSVYKGSLWEVKTLLPQSEIDDSRPILFLKDHGLPGLTCIMGGKIDNVYDMYQELLGIGQARAS